VKVNVDAEGTFCMLDLEDGSPNKYMRKTRKRKRIVIVAGPNGAGKTTFAKRFLPKEAGFLEFVNADLIAQGLSPFAPGRAAIRAGRIMLERIAEHVRNRHSFAFETTLAGLNYARHIPRWRKMGYHVRLVFLSLPFADSAVARVRMRVAQGGHDVPEQIIRRRFDSGLRNFRNTYQTLVNAWDLYDNSASVPRLIASGKNK
jgi:predicted ABC-type ATPase